MFVRTIPRMPSVVRCPKCALVLRGPYICPDCNPPLNMPRHLPQQGPAK
jgi:hypothetical protein